MAEPDKRSMPLKLPERLPAAVLHWLRGFLAGLFAAAMASPEQRRERQLVRWAHEWRQWVQHLVDSAVARPQDDPDTLFPLRAALIGRARTEILVVLGPPPATSVPEPETAKAKLHAPAYLTAESWYYPLDVREHLAIALTFVDDLVASVERISGPRGE